LYIKTEKISDQKKWQSKQYHLQTSITKVKSLENQPILNGQYVLQLLITHVYKNKNDQRRLKKVEVIKGTLILNQFIPKAKITRIRGPLSGRL
jgi:hypothetical protein